MAKSDTQPDAIIIGGGHNGLTCAFYLARSGMNVRVVEARGVVGGAAVTEEFHPGFRNSVASYTVSLLQPRVIADMGLVQRGYRVIERPVSNFLPLPQGDHLILGGGLERTQAEFARFSKRDAEALPGYYAMLDRVADVLRDLALRPPPNIGSGIAGLVEALTTGRLLSRLSRDVQRDVLELFTKSAREFLSQWFESAPVQAAFGFDAVVGNYASPDTPGSAYVLLHHVFGEVNGNKGSWGHVVGIHDLIAGRARLQATGIGEIVARQVQRPVGRLLQMPSDAVAFVQLRGRHRQAGFQLEDHVLFATGRQDIAVAVQLGGQVARPSLRIPALSTRGQIGFVEDDRDGRIVQHAIEALQAVLDGRLQRHQHHLGRAAAQGIRVKRIGVVFQHDVGARFMQRHAQALARLARARQQGDAFGFTHGHGRFPAGRTRCASGPAPGTACPGNAARRCRKRAGGACRRYAR